MNDNQDCPQQEIRGEIDILKQKLNQVKQERMQSNDPWIHRSSGMRCRTCMYFCPKNTAETFGRCRRHAPTMSGFPAVYPTDWCGDHKIDENKI